ncbi:unnamed protein product [Dicrocoelium dendriticum]|nr:unnamed protein product [Dicrocoelium dendriticum]
MASKGALSHAGLGDTQSARTATDQLTQPSNSNMSSLHDSPDSLQRLLSLVRALTPKDIGFDIRWVTDVGVYAAPVAYVHVTENEVFSMGIFILRPGSRIPLHDHPGMYGVLRVIYGSIRCRSFSRLQNVKAINSDCTKSAFAKLYDSRWQLSDLIMVRPFQDVILTPESQTQLLAPDEGNLHEITPVDGPAVFLDILAPPYDHDLGTRECRFYKEIVLPHQIYANTSFNGDTSQTHTTPHAYSDDSASTTTTEVFDSDDQQCIDNDGSRSPLIYLIETNQPKDYWCEAAEYAGPSVV